MTDIRLRAISMLKRFAADLRGLSAVEFALIAPLLITMYFGTAEIDAGLAARRKVTTAANTVADLVARDDVITPSELSGIYTSVGAIMAPYDVRNTVEIVISSLRLNAQSRAAVVWSVGQNKAPRGVGSTVTVPTGLLSGTNTVIMAEISFPYNAPLAKTLTGTVNMRDTFYLRPRRGMSVCYAPNANTKTC